MSMDKVTLVGIIFAFGFFGAAYTAEKRFQLDDNEEAYRSGQQSVQSRIKDYSKVIVWAEDHGAYVLFKAKNGDSIVFWRPPSWRKK